MRYLSVTFVAIQVHLIEAELALALGDASKSIKLYKQSILLAEKNGFLNEAAIAYERAAKLFLTSKPAFATKLLLNSYNNYRKWGAKTKMKHMVKEFPSFLNDETLESLKHYEVENVQICTDSSSCVSELSGSVHKKKRVRFE